ncbi:MAG: NAD(P)-dependent oxidoreductase [Bradyrhizobiaceae bacterium]|nr:NAD(P)-dependent oxidoreductase [Bradyrhizobiaceae bacterium]
MTDKPRIGFIGIGIMGEAMTRRLLDQGYRVTAWNRGSARLGLVTSHGAVGAPSPAEVTSHSDVVLMCVLNTDAVESCVFGENGIARTAKRGQLLIDFSTADPYRTRDMALRLRDQNGMTWVDAPVSGGPDAARNGTLTVMAGGESDDIEAIRPLMADVAGNFTHMGPVGAGQTTKIINQTIVGTGFVVMAEALALAESAGIDAARLPECLAGGLADSSLLRRIYPQMHARAFVPPKSYARQLLKDMKALIEFAGGLGLTLPAAKTATELYAAHVDAGNAMRDSASIVDHYQTKPRRGH